MPLVQAGAITAVEQVIFTLERKRLDLHVKFPRGGRKLCNNPLAPSVTRSVRYMTTMNVPSGTYGFLSARVTIAQCDRQKGIVIDDLR